MILKTNISEIRLKSSKKIFTLLRNIKFSLEKGKIYTLLGPNGSGKSTLLLVLTGLDNKRFIQIEGNVEFNGKNIDSYSQNELIELRKHEIKIIFQDSTAIFDPLKKLGYYFTQAKYNSAEIEELLSYFQLPNYKSVANLFPHELSGGMAQRIQIVLALLAKPKLIFLDEPTSALDYPIANILRKKIHEISVQFNTTVFIITQDTRFALAVSDFVGTIENSTIEKFDPVQNLNIEKLASKLLVT